MISEVFKQLSIEFEVIDAHIKDLGKKEKALYTKLKLALTVSKNCQDALEILSKISCCQSERLNWGETKRAVKVALDLMESGVEISEHNANMVLGYELFKLKSQITVK